MHRRNIAQVPVRDQQPRPIAIPQADFSRRPGPDEIIVGTHVVQRPVGRLPSLDVRHPVFGPLAVALSPTRRQALGAELRVPCVGSVNDDEMCLGTVSSLGLGVWLSSAVLAISGPVPWSFLCVGLVPMAVYTADGVTQCPGGRLRLPVVPWTSWPAVRASDAAYTAFIAALAEAHHGPVTLAAPQWVSSEIPARIQAVVPPRLREVVFPDPASRHLEQRRGSDAEIDATLYAAWLEAHSAARDFTPTVAHQETAERLGTRPEVLRDWLLRVRAAAQFGSFGPRGLEVYAYLLDQLHALEADRPGTSLVRDFVDAGAVRCQDRFMATFPSVLRLLELANSAGLRATDDPVAAFQAALPVLLEIQTRLAFHELAAEAWSGRAQSVHLALRAMVLAGLSPLPLVERFSHVSRGVTRADAKALLQHHLRVSLPSGDVGADHPMLARLAADPTSQTLLRPLTARFTAAFLEALEVVSGYDGIPPGPRPSPVSLSQALGAYDPDAAELMGIQDAVDVVVAMANTSALHGLLITPKSGPSFQCRDLLGSAGDIQTLATRLYTNVDMPVELAPAFVRLLLVGDDLGPAVADAVTHERVRVSHLLEARERPALRPGLGPAVHSWGTEDVRFDLV